MGHDGSAQSRHGSNGLPAKGKASPGAAAPPATAPAGLPTLSVVLVFSVLAVGVNLSYYSRALKTAGGAEENPDAFLPESWRGAEEPDVPRQPSSSSGLRGGAGPTVEDARADTGAGAAAVVGDPPAEASPVSIAPGGYRAKYGFYIHCFDSIAPIKYQVEKIKEFFPGSPIYIMSDGGEDYSELCRREGCQFVLCPPANDRWHPWPFVRRFLDATIALKTEYVIMLEPDNTIHGPIKREPNADAGGIESISRSFRHKAYIEGFARQIAGKEGFQWTKRAMEAGLAGGSYFRSEAILDSFTDERVAALDWNLLGEGDKKIFSSDFAMPYLLAARGWSMQPWPEIAQMEKDPKVPHTGAADASFKHYSRGFPGGKPTYRLQKQPGDEQLSAPAPLKYSVLKKSLNCQLCYSLDEYVKRWGTTKCTNHIPFRYSDKLQKQGKGGVWQADLDSQAAVVAAIHAEPAAQEAPVAVEAEAGG